MSTYSEPTYWLTLIHESGLKLNVLKPVIQRWCVAGRRPLADLFELSALEWSTTVGLSEREADRAVAARDKLPQQAALLAQWQAEGIEPLLQTDPRYPRRLVYTLPVANQPLILWVRGQAGLLNEPGLVILGSQEPDELLARLIGDLTKTLVGEGIGLVSGYGRGLDRATFEVMMATENGHAVTVLPMGLSAFAKTTTKLDAAVTSGRVVLVSPFTPSTPFQEKLAEARNLLIDHLALTLLIPQADEDSLARATAALNRGVPIFVGLTDTAHNRALIDQGALLLTDAGEVVEMVQQAIIDAALLEPAAVEPAALPAAPSSPAGPADTGESFNLRSEEVEPLDSDEALEILSMGGNIPEVLRKRLQTKKD